MGPRRRALSAAVGNVTLLAPAWWLSASPTGVHAWLVVGLSSVFAAVEAASAGADDRTNAVLPIGPTLTALSLLATLVVALVTAAATTSVIAVVVGVPLTLVGIGLRAASMRALGPAFVSQTRPCSPGAWVRHGPYRWLRHPSELGLVAIATGLALGAGSAAAVGLVGLVVVPVVAVRTRIESRELDRSRLHVGMPG